MKKETIEVKFLFNINIDMYVYAELTTSHNAREAIERLSPGDVLLADPEFFTRENCGSALAKEIKPAIKLLKNARKGLVIKICGEAFEKKRYRRRMVREAQRSMIAPPCFTWILRDREALSS